MVAIIKKLNCGHALKKMLPVSSVKVQQLLEWLAQPNPDLMQMTLMMFSEAGDILFFNHAFTYATIQR